MHMPHTESQNQLRVLILSDRLFYLAIELSKILTAFDIRVLGITNSKEEVLSIAKEQSFHYLIIAGYLKDLTLYDAIRELYQQHTCFIPVHWALLDPLIHHLCFRYKIPLKFERSLPVKDFVTFLTMHKNDRLPFGLDRV